MISYLNQIIKFKENIDSLPIKDDEKKRLRTVCNNITDSISIENEQVKIKEGKAEELLSSIDHFLKYITLILNSAIIDSSLNQTKE
jgi:hypothetical protein